MPSLWYGEYEDVSGEQSCHLARQLILRKIEVLIPDVLKDLLGAPFSLFLDGKLNECDWDIANQIFRSLESIHTHSIEPEYLLPYHGTQFSLNEHKKWLELWSKLQQWQKKHNLTIFPWIIERAFQTLKMWSNNSEKARRISFYSGSAEFTTFSFEDFSLSLPAWEPSFFTKADFLSNAKHTFDAAIREYVSNIEAELERSGNYKPSETKLTLDHFEWLILYHVQRWSLEKIRQSKNGKRVNNTQAISQGIKSAEKVLRISRNRKRGRR